MEVINGLEKNTVSIKKAASKCSILMIIVTLLSFLSNILLIIVRNISADFNNLILGMSDEYSNVMFGMVPVIFIDIVVIVIGLKWTKISFKKEFINKGRYDKKTILIGMISLAGLLLLSNSIYTIYSTIINSMGIVIPSPDFTFPTNINIRIIYILYVCILGPILEEIIFRGIILNYMKKYGLFVAIIFSAVLFTMFHMNLVQFITPLLIGILFGFICIKTESIVPSIILHIVNNSYATIMSYIYVVNISLASKLWIGFLGIAAIGLVILFTKYFKEINEIFSYERKSSNLKRKFINCFLNGGFLAYMIIYSGLILITFLRTN